MELMESNVELMESNVSSISAFKQIILKFIRRSPNKVHKVHNPSGIKLLTRLPLRLSHLPAQKFSHNLSHCQ